VIKKGGTHFEIAYTGQEKIKGMGLLTIPQGKEPRFIDAQLIQVFPQQIRINLRLEDYPVTRGNRTFVVTIDRGNNVSPLTELK
jgi:hypothetical protein